MHNGNWENGKTQRIMATCSHKSLPKPLGRPGKTQRKSRCVAIKSWEDSWV